MNADEEAIEGRIARLEAELEVSASSFYTLVKIMEGILALETGAKDEGERRSFAQVAMTRLRELETRLKFEEPE